MTWEHKPIFQESGGGIDVAYLIPTPPGEEGQWAIRGNTVSHPNFNRAWHIFKLGLPGQDEWYNSIDFVKTQMVSKFVTDTNYIVEGIKTYLESQRG